MTRFWLYKAGNENEQVIWRDTILFFAMHLLAVYAIAFHFAWQWVALAVGSYYLRMFALSAGFHRYFSHRSYKTGRAFAFFARVRQHHVA